MGAKGEVDVCSVMVGVEGVAAVAVFTGVKGTRLKLEALASVIWIGWVTAVVLVKGVEGANVLMMGDVGTEVVTVMMMVLILVRLMMLVRMGGWS